MMRSLLPQISRNYAVLPATTTKTSTLRCLFSIGTLPLRPRLAAPARTLATKTRPAFPEGSIYTKESDVFRAVHFDPNEKKTGQEVPAFRQFANELFVRHRPSKHAFFAELRNAPKAVVTNQGFLNELYKRYQAAMHCTRVWVYHAPHLNHPAHRQRKLSILSDDDAIDKVSHHHQLEAMFKSFGATPLSDDHFGDTDELKTIVDPSTAAFISTVERLYVRSTGAWCIAEVLSDDWLSAFAESLSAHFPNVKQAQYFDEIFTGHVEIVHMLETVALTEAVLSKHPHKLRGVQEDMAEMCVALDGLWSNLQYLVRYPEQYLTK